MQESGSNHKSKSANTTAPEPPETHSDKDIFYSREWRRKEITFIKSGTPVDIMIDDQFLYIIEPPKKSSVSSTSATLGYLLFSGLVANAAAHWGESQDEKRREEARRQWVNEEGQLISNDYEDYVVMRFPLEHIDGSVDFSWTTVEISLQKESVTLTRRRERSILGSKSDKQKELKNYLERIGVSTTGTPRSIPLSLWGFFFLIILLFLAFVFITAPSSTG